MVAATPARHLAAYAGLSVPYAQALLDVSAAGAPGWRVERTVRDDSASVLEVFDSAGDLMGMVASTPHRLVSIDAAWRGMTRDPEGRRRWWAVAIGHAWRDTELRVSFARRCRNGMVGRTQAAIARADGLWVGVVAGRQTTVALRQGPHHLVRRVFATFGATASTSEDRDDRGQ